MASVFIWFTSNELQLFRILSNEDWKKIYNFPSIFSSRILILKIFIDFIHTFTHPRSSLTPIMNCNDKAKNNHSVTAVTFPFCFSQISILSLSILLSPLFSRLYLFIQLVFLSLSLSHSLSFFFLVSWFCSLCLDGIYLCGMFIWYVF